MSNYTVTDIVNSTVNTIDFTQLKYITNYGTDVEFLYRTNSNTFGLCINWDGLNVIYFFLLYFLCMYVFEHLHKRHQLTTHLMGTLVTYYTLATGSTDLLFDYYLYDIVLSVMTKDWLMVAHHLLTMRCLVICSYDMDFSKMQNTILMLKSGDIFLNHYKIIDAADLHTESALIYQLFSVVMTMLMWIPFRIIFPFWVYPFNTFSLNMLAVVIHTANFYWMIKLWHLAKKIGNKLQMLLDD